MDDIPDEIRQWLAQKVVEWYAAWLFRTYIRVWCRDANRELLRLYIWLCIMLSTIRDSLPALHSQEEIEPATSYNAVAEAIREDSSSFNLELSPIALAVNSISVNLVLSPIALAVNSISVNLVLSPIALAVNSISDSFKPPVLSGLVTYGIYNNFKPPVLLTSAEVTKR